MSSKKSPAYAIVIIGILFFVFGFVTWLNGTLIPFLKLACQLKSDVQAFLVTSAFYMAYFFLAIPSSYILKSTGFKNGMALGLVVMAAGSLVFIPAANARSFPLFLIGLFVQAAGLALLQTASNPYISIVGPIESAAKRISIMGICNKGAGALSPLILSALILKDAGPLEAKILATTNVAQKEILLTELASRVVMPYIVIAIVLVLLALMIKKSSLPEIEAADDNTAANAQKTAKTSILQFPYLLLGAVCIFAYVGVEVLSGDAIGTYGKTMGMSIDKTKNFTTYTLIAMLVGYVAGIFIIPKYLSQQTALKLSALVGLLFCVIIYFTDGFTAITFIALLGLANSLMWPAIFPMAIDKLGVFTKIGSAVLVMGIVGGAVVPLLYPFLKTVEGGGLSNNLAFFVSAFPCYLYILFYALKGYKIGK